MGKKKKEEKQSERKFCEVRPVECDNKCNYAGCSKMKRGH